MKPDPSKKQFVIVFTNTEDPTRAQASTVFAALSLLGVHVVDGSVPGNVLVEGNEADIAQLLEGSKEWTYTPVHTLGPAGS